MPSTRQPIFTSNLKSVPYISLSPLSSSFFHELIHVKKNNINKRSRNERTKKEEEERKHNRKRRRRCIRNARKYGEGLIVGGGCGVGSPAINRGRSASDFKDSSWCVKTHRGFRLPLFMLLDPRSSGGPGMSTVFFPKRDSTVTINYCLDPRHG